MQILVDVWEGSLDVDEHIFKQAGVAGLIIRINGIGGGLYLDDNFVTQWDQAEQFLKAPYFVYTPYSSPKTNFDFLMTIIGLSKGSTIVFVDVEVRKANYSPEQYGKDFGLFWAMLDHYKIRKAIYTGGWFLPILTPWIKADYWWGRYPYTLCPPGDRVNWTWDQFRAKAFAYGFDPDPRKLCPGTVKLWQCSGDKVILPGTAKRPIDLNLFNGSIEDLEHWWGAKTPAPPIDRLEILWREAQKRGWELNP